MTDTLIVYTPKLPIYPNKRFLVSPNQLQKYISQQNANKVISEAKILKTNKRTLKFRKFGKIEIYLK